MTIDQKLECLKLAVALTENPDLNKLTPSASLETVKSYYVFFCQLVSELDLDDPNSLIDLVDDVSNILS